MLPVRPADVGDAGVRQSQDNPFYVSPFIEMTMRYDCRVAPPRKHVQRRILETARDGPLLATTFNGRRRALDNVGLPRVLRFALVALKIVAANRRRCEGARLLPRQNAALNPRLATAKSVDYTSSALSARGEG